MARRLTILMTNDDGIHAPGIRHLWNALSPIADIFVVAPATEQSATGLSITIRYPLRIEEINWLGAPEGRIFSISGTPTDCVKLALSVILPSPPDLIVSGINKGSNAGRNVFYSGTVAAVIEGIMRDIPGIAFSMADYYTPNYERVECHIPSLVQYLIEHPLPSGTFLNVNFPKENGEEIKGIRFTKQGLEYWGDNPEQREHPAEGSSYYWLGVKVMQFNEHEDSDISLLREGYATAVPIHVGNLTHHDILEQQKDHFENFVNFKRCATCIN